ncbi:MAG TPA: DUF3520 domain-containing protein [Deltaproteobacteria bacterium]|nr:DUF3520 domain-containing protein [Deltaproteobacteria bacterium]
MAENELPDVADEAGGAGGASGPATHLAAQDKAPSKDELSEPIGGDITGESYRDYGINAFVETRSDPLSTFAVDVDTASYTVTRRMLTDGYLPPPAAVRVEEFVNYFPYQYAPPAGGDPFGVDFDAAPSPWDEGTTLLRIGVQGKKVSFEERKPVHLTFLIDVSGSMRSADKLDLIKHSLTMLTEELDDGDTVAIATYAGAEKVVLEPTSIGRRDVILRALKGLSSGGSTAMGSGMDLAYRLAEASYAPGSVNRVVVCSDGDANVGATSPEVISERVRGYADRGITMTTLGFGNGNYSDVMMERLANDGDGNYFYIDSEREARRVLVDQLTSTLEVIARDVKLQIAFEPRTVERYRLGGYENRDVADDDFRNDRVDAGEIGAGHQVTALYELRLVPGASGKLAEVRVRNKAPGPDSPAVERTFPVSTSAIRGAFAEATSATRIAASAAYFADKLRAAPGMEEISFSQLAQLARSARRIEYPQDEELVSLIERAGVLAGERPLAGR